MEKIAVRLEGVSRVPSFVTASITNCYLSQESTSELALKDEVIESVQIFLSLPKVDRDARFHRERIAGRKMCVDLSGRGG